MLRGARRVMGEGAQTGLDFAAAKARNTQRLTLVKRIGVEGGGLGVRKVTSGPWITDGVAQTRRSREGTHGGCDGQRPRDEKLGGEHDGWYG